MLEGGLDVGVDDGMSRPPAPLVRLLVLMFEGERLRCPTPFMGPLFEGLWSSWMYMGVDCTSLTLPPAMLLTPMGTGFIIMLLASPALFRPLFMLSLSFGPIMLLLLLLL